MTKRADNLLEHLKVTPAAPEQEPILAHLLELYAHDFSEFHSIELGADGRFGYRDLPLYWSEAGRHPFLVTMDGKPAGLVLVKRGLEILGNEAIWDMAEFFVVRGHRRHGVGTEVAHQVWRRFPGRWEVRVMEENPALHFWKRAISAFAGETIHSVRFENDGVSWHLFRFESSTVLAAT